MYSLASNPCCTECGSQVKLYWVRDPDTGRHFYLCEPCLDAVALV